MSTGPSQVLRCSGCVPRTCCTRHARHRKRAAHWQRGEVCVVGMHVARLPSRPGQTDQAAGRGHRRPVHAPGHVHLCARRNILQPDVQITLTSSSQLQHGFNIAWEIASISCYHYVLYRIVKVKLKILDSIIGVQQGDLFIRFIYLWYYDGMPGGEYPFRTREDHHLVIRLLDGPEFCSV